MINTFFKTRKGRKWTRTFPNQIVKSQMDYILTPIDSNKIKIFSVKNFPHTSDHSLIDCKMIISGWL